MNAASSAPARIVVSGYKFIPTGVAAKIPLTITLEDGNGNAIADPLQSPVEISGSVYSVPSWGTFTCDGQTGATVTLQSNPTSCTINSNGTGPGNAELVIRAIDGGAQAIVPYTPLFPVLYQFKRRLALDCSMAGSYNDHTYGYDLAISESSSHFITLLPSTGYLRVGPEIDVPTPRGVHPGAIAPCTIRGGEFCFAEPGAIGVVKRDGSIEEIRTPTPGAFIGGIATDGRDDVWFSEPYAGQIGRVTARFGIHEYPTGIPGSRITALTLTAGVNNVGIVGGFTFTDSGTNSVGGFAQPLTGLGPPELTEMPVPTANSAPTVIGGLFFGESNAARVGFLGATEGYAGGPVVDFASDGIVTSLTQSGNNEWATTTKDILEEIAVPQPGASPGPPITTSVPGFDNLRDLIWTGNASGRASVIFLAGDASGTAILQLQ